MFQKKREERYYEVREKPNYRNFGVDKDQVGFEISQALLGLNSSSFSFMFKAQG